MNIRIFLPVLLATLAFTACQPMTARFSEPQPQGARDLGNIPNRIQGKYRSLADSSLLLVGNRCIVRVYDKDTDTVFNLDSGHLLRKLKGYYFLNIPWAANSWDVKKLALHKHGILTLGEIASVDEINKLVALTDIPEDSSGGKVFDPSRKEFKEFVKSEGFSGQESFVRED